MFLVDTGVEISLIPNTDPNSKPSDFKLFAANNSTIHTFGETELVLNLRLKRPLAWKFRIAEVPSPILGADFLNYYGLIVDVHQRRLNDPYSNTFSVGYLALSDDPSVSVFIRDSRYSKIFTDFPEVTGAKPAKPVTASDVFHHIETTGPLVSERTRRLIPEKYKIAQTEFEDLVKQGICRHSKSPWASPIHMVRSKNRPWRICGDCRSLNSRTVRDKYPIPYLQDYSMQLLGKRVFSKLDLHRAYYQIPVAPTDDIKTAVTTPFGLYEYVFMPFGLRNAAQSFQRFINRVMSDLDFIFVYLDDILIFSSTPEEHEKHLRIVLERLKESGLRLNLSKCELGKSEIVFLSHLVNHEGSKPCAEKVEAILEYPKPSTVADLHRFLGMINFFRRSIPHAAAIQAPLYEYMHNTKKNDQTPMAWTPEAEQAFEQCKTSLAKATLLSHPSTEAETRLVTDASDFAMGASLEQYIDNISKSLAFFSRKFSSSQRNYSAYDRELTAIYESIKYLDQISWKVEILK